MDIADLRKEYTFAGLRRCDLHPHPIQQFNNWFQQAISAAVPEPNAMVLATVDCEGQPSSRVVLLKGIDQRGLSFYTNYRSRKGAELAANPRAALTIFWAELERQISVRGTCSRLSHDESEIYFKSRPIGNRLGAWVSTTQSAAIPNREHLEKKLEEMTARFNDNPPMPDYWGGYVLKPITLELWQGRPNRLHDRFLYTREGDGWKLERLSP
jgi:pyridoxamine 5'-phosphate oxidase